MSIHQHKASNYALALDDARCEGNWETVQELVRKVRKHAPERNCLALTAETECAIATRTAAQAGRPSTAASAKELEVTRVLPRLLTAIDEETRFGEDRFQAQVCIGWLHWFVGEYNLAAVRLPKSVENDYAQLESGGPTGSSSGGSTGDGSAGGGGASEWTKVCALKAAYLKANCLERADDSAGALAVFEAALPALTSVWTLRSARSQVRYWAELFLMEFCMLHSQALRQGTRTLRDDPNALACFRAWAKYWEASSSSGLSSAGGATTGGFGFRGAVPRRRVWCEYYAAISAILAADLPFPTGQLAPLASSSSEAAGQDNGPVASARSRLRVELKKVEATYEALLLAETQFPRAEEDREEVEAFVDLVMKNWAVLAGRGWREQDLGQGGRESLSRGVLDILYKASTRTFHSTAILRHLAMVHVAVAEFDLAFSSFDSYLAIVKKGRARVKKTGHAEPNLDSDATILESMSLAVAVACRYGGREAAEKARDLGDELEKWFTKGPSTPAEGHASPRDGNGSANVLKDIPPNVQSMVWQAIGLAQASWSRMTFDAAARTDIQTKAIQCLRKSLAPDLGHSRDLRTLFALALLLSEKRELGAGIEVVKSALIFHKSEDGEADIYAGPYWQERSLVPFWHLLALLLSAKQDYLLAARACEGAFEQFKDPAVLFGSADLQPHFRSDHLNEANEKRVDSKRGLVDEMDDFEKESILEVKMTQLALVELLEGPDVAVNASYELLSLYARLFGTADAPVKVEKPSTEMPKSSAGTLRSIKGSIFGRSDRANRLNRQASVTSGDKSSATSRPQTRQTETNFAQAPTIQVTNENGATADQGRSRKSAAVSHKRSESAKRGSLHKRDSGANPRRTVSSSGLPREPTIVDGESYFTPDAELNHHHSFFSFSSSHRQSSTYSAPKSRTLPHMDSYVSSKFSSSELAEEPVHAKRTALNSSPVIQFPKDQEKRARSAILAKVWLMIAGFYRRAGMYDDCKGAVSEAQKLVKAMESDATRDSSGTAALRKPGWASKKCIDELSGDVYAELGNLSLAKDAPYLARAEFESALMHYPDHPTAIVGLSNILLDIYNETLLPPPAIPGLNIAGSSLNGLQTNSSTLSSIELPVRKEQIWTDSTLPCSPLGLGATNTPPAVKKAATNSPLQGLGVAEPSSSNSIFAGSILADAPALSARPMTSGALSTTTTATSIAAAEEARLPPPYKARSLPLVDRLAARDRACALLSGLTKLGTGWNRADAWFALARAHEESGQPERAKDLLWWCVELEEGGGVREWASVGRGGYVL